MRTRFDSAPVRTVTLKRPEGERTFTIHALPLGYSMFVERVYPMPTDMIDGVPVPRQSARSEWQYDINLACIAKALGDEVEAQPPSTSDRTAWAAYIAAVRQEFSDANLVDGDIGILAGEVGKAQRGLSDLGKAS